jgi:hypothetical protein
MPVTRRPLKRLLPNPHGGGRRATGSPLALCEKFRSDCR